MFYFIRSKRNSIEICDEQTNRPTDRQTFCHRCEYVSSNTVAIIIIQKKLSYLEIIRKLIIFSLKTNKKTIKNKNKNKNKTKGNKWKQNRMAACDYICLCDDLSLIPVSIVAACAIYNFWLFLTVQNGLRDIYCLLLITLNHVLLLY